MRIIGGQKNIIIIIPFIGRVILSVVFSVTSIIFLPPYNPLQSGHWVVFGFQLQLQRIGCVTAPMSQGVLVLLGLALVCQIGFFQNASRRRGHLFSALSLTAEQSLAA